MQSQEVTVLSGLRISQFLTKEFSMKIKCALLITSALLCMSTQVSAKSNSKSRPGTKKYVACAKNPSLEKVIKSTKLVKLTADKYFGKNGADAQAYANSWVEKYPCEFASNLYYQAEIASEIIDTYYEGISPLEGDFLTAMIAADICLDKAPLFGAKTLFQTARNNGMSVSESNEFVRTQLSVRGYRSIRCKAPYIY